MKHLKKHCIVPFIIYLIVIYHRVKVKMSSLVIQSTFMVLFMRHQVFSV